MGDVRVSRQHLHLDPTDEGKPRFILLGFDRPFNTLYAALYEGLESEGEEIPTKAFGYHPAEQGCTPPGTEYGIYPADIGDFDRILTEWGLSEREREMAGRLLAKDEDYDGPELVVA